MRPSYRKKSNFYLAPPEASFLFTEGFCGIGFLGELGAVPLWLYAIFAAHGSTVNLKLAYRPTDTLGSVSPHRGSHLGSTIGYCQPDASSVSPLQKA